MEELLDSLTITWEEERMLKDILKSRVKMICCVETGEIYKNKAELARALGVTGGAVTSYFNGRTNSLKKKHFVEKYILKKKR